MPSNPNPFYFLIIILLGVFLVQSVHLMTYAAFVDSNWCEAEVAFMKEGSDCCLINIIWRLIDVCVS